MSLTQFIRIAHILKALILLLVLLGSILEQQIRGQIPCPYCVLQRSVMALTAAGVLLNIRTSIQIAHYGLILLSALLGASISLMHIALHACPGTFSYGLPVFGLSLYTWAFLVFTACILSTAVFLLLYNPKQSEPQPFKTPEKALFAFAIIIVNTLLYLTYVQCGTGDCQEFWPPF